MVSAITVNAQDFLNTDLTNVKADNLSEIEIVKIKTQLQSRGLTIEASEPILLSKGMKADEYAKLKVRINNTASQGSQTVAAGDRSQNEKASTKIIKTDSISKMFGADLFTGASLTFEPSLKMATPVNYILGAGDELQISVFGVQEMNSNAAINTEGKINIPFVGQIMLSGMTIEAATQKIKSSLSRIYSTIASGQSQVGISLSKIRTIKITLIGAKQPGNYSISSLSSVYNALYVGGGPAASGTYRNIELIRNNKVLKIIDIYRFLVNGDQSDNIGLKENDVIRIPVYLHRVFIQGEVVRQGIFEMKQNETFEKLLGFASGFTDSAYKNTINVTKKTDKEYKIDELKSNQFKTYMPQNGDSFKVSKILNRFENRVTISGSVFRPDAYSFFDGMKLIDLVNKADGITQDAYLKRVIITRVNDDLTTKVLTVDLAQALNGSAENNIELRKEDVVSVYSIFNFKEKFSVTIDGAVKAPGTFLLSENLTLNDLILQAGGLTSAASKKIEISRMVKSDVINNNNGAKIDLLTVDIDNTMNEQSQQIFLKPFDVISVRRIAVYDIPEMIVVKGAVVYPGRYSLQNKKEKVFDVIKRAGGLLSTANFDAVRIKRPIETKQIEAIDDVNLNLGKDGQVENETTRKIANEIKYLIIPIDWKKLKDNPRNNTNVTLFADDEIEIGVFNENVKVVGNVILNSEIPYKSGKGFNYYINSVGGTDFKGWKKRAYIIYPNGKAAVTKSFLFFRNYPSVTPGSQIVVPEKPLKEKSDLTGVISIAGILASLAGVVIAILR